MLQICCYFKHGKIKNFFVELCFVANENSLDVIAYVAHSYYCLTLSIVF